MKRTICNNEYDTQNATQVHKYTYSYYGDPAGYEETLYQTPGGHYFLHMRGGADSPYPKENILRLAKTKVRQWIENH